MCAATIKIASELFLSHEAN